MPRLHVTEYQLQSKRCPQCQALTLAPAPANVNATVQYGPGGQALAAYLSQVQLLPDQRICQLFAEILGLPVSSGSIHHFIARCAAALHPVEEAIKSALRQTEVLHQDETGLYQHILAQDLGYTYLHSFVAGKTRRYAEKK